MNARETGMEQVINIRHLVSLYLWDPSLELESSFPWILSDRMDPELNPHNLYRLLLCGGWPCYTPTSSIAAGGDIGNGLVPCTISW